MQRKTPIWLKSRWSDRGRKRKRKRPEKGDQRAAAKPNGANACNQRTGTLTVHERKRETHQVLE